MILKSPRGVEAFEDLKADLKGRRRLVSTLTREAYLPRPLLITGQVVEELEKAGGSCSWTVAAS